MYWRTLAMGAPPQEAVKSLGDPSTPFQYRLRRSGRPGGSRRRQTPLSGFTSERSGAFSGYSMQMHALVLAVHFRQCHLEVSADASEDVAQSVDRCRT
jgi:hypothetical protein